MGKIEGKQAIESGGGNSSGTSEGSGGEPITPSISERPHIYPLDGVRGLAIVMVLFAHFSPFSSLILDLGWSGVDLFFVLSGFLITGILYDAKGVSRHFFRDFYARRVLRIFPLYYGVLTIWFFILPHFFSLKQLAIESSYQHQIWLWTYTSNFALHWVGWMSPNMSHFWSLAVEEHFYMLWPLLVYHLNRRQLMSFCVGGMVFTLVLRTGIVAHHGSWVFTHYLTYSRIDELLCGCLIALGMRAPERAFLLRMAKYVGWSCLALLATIFLWRHGLRFTDWPVRTLGYTLLAGLYGSLVAVCVSSPNNVLSRFFSWGGLRFLGKYSYGTYVIHNLIAPYLGNEFPMSSMVNSDFWGKSEFLSIRIFISVGLAVASYHLFEIHFLKLKRYFHSRKYLPSGREVIT